MNSPGPSHGRHDNDRVVITGIGAITSVGIGVDAFLHSLQAGASGARPITSFDTTGFAYANGCEVVGFDPRTWIDGDVDRYGRATQFSIAGAKLALADAGLRVEDARERRCLVSVGTTNGESRELDLLIEREARTGERSVNAVQARRATASLLSMAICQELGLADAEAGTIATACAAGNYAIGYGFDVLRSGDADLALCGGVDAFCRKTFSGFYRLGTIAPERCQPFDRNRRGILTGEGAGILVMERLETALARGARVYAEVLGYGLTCDAHHPVAPEQDSIARCISLAHADAGVTPDAIDFISAHGTGTKANDLTEVAAIRQVFGEDTPPVISIKSMLGHSMGAASALACAACALAVSVGFIPPTINHTETDPECPIDCVPNTARTADVRVVQNSALAFGGNNAVVVLGKYEERVPCPV